MAILLLVFCVIISTATSSIWYNPTVCDTDACYAIGESIRRSIDKSRDPCTNFYEYGCGLWPTYNSLPPSELQWSMISKIALQTLLNLKEIFEHESLYDYLAPVQKTKQYYNSCMDENAIEKQGLVFIQSILDANGGWPILSGTHKLSNHTWQEIDNNYMKIFFTSTFFEFEILPEEKDATKNILMLAQGVTPFLEDQIITKSKSQFSLSEEYKITNVISAFKRHKGIDTSPENFSADVTELLIFEQNLKNISEYESEIQKGLKIDKDRMTIAELQEYYDQAEVQNSIAQINWLHMIQELFKSANVMQVDALSHVLVYNKRLLHKLAHLLDVTPSHVIVNYIQWNLVNQLLPYLNKEIRDILFETIKMNYNVTAQQPRWKTCVRDVPLQDALAALYIKKYHSSVTISGVKDMLNDLKLEMKEHILNSEWMNDNAKNFMIDKIDNIISLIGYPHWIQNETALIERYEGLDIGQNYLKNKIVSVTFEKKRRYKDYFKPVDRSQWPVSPLTINAFYAAALNLMVIPAAIVQYPYFTPDLPLAINYGTIGMILGHELAHSFDTTGIEYDKFGNKVDKVDKETNQAYEERVQCFIDEYNNFTLITEGKDGKLVHLNGLLTKDENVADNIGLEIAFTAFQKRKLLAGPQRKLPGLLDISDEQLFFLSFTNFWCMTTTKQIEAIIANKDSHSPNKFRILGTVANMDSFSDAFNCPVDSPLNQEPKCTLWN